ncbi:MAG: DUF4932 domain-containing protein [Steroidobacteraceae bacterium]
MDETKFAARIGAITKNLVKLSLFIFLASAAHAQESLPTIQSNAGYVSVQQGDKLSKNSWRLSPSLKPDVYKAMLLGGKPNKVTFITDLDSISFEVEEGKHYDFIIKKGDELCFTQIVGVRLVPDAVFDERYRKQHQDKIQVDVPEVYELVNIAIAMTPTGIADRNLVYKDSDYYQRVRAWFDSSRTHPLLAALDKELRDYPSYYFNMKMDGFAFEYDKNGRIVQSKVFDRASWGVVNTLRPFIDQLQSFSDTTNFRKFFRENRKTYQQQINFYRKVADIAEMKRWLERNFPSTHYDSYNIIFSPLVNGNQSSIHFESNGFKELQPHVNFPYLEKKATQRSQVSEKSWNLARGNILFTELNHGYINPEAEKYGERVANAISHNDHWIGKMSAQNYQGVNIFNEYMNWALLTLRILDYVPASEQKPLIEAVENTMVNNRQFPQFVALDRFLIPLYKERRPGQTVADLYPNIIQWFEDNNVESLGSSASN